MRTNVVRLEGKVDIEKILEKISGNDALEILNKLASENRDIAKKIEKIVSDIGCKVDINEVAKDVFGDLDWLDIEELNDRSGETRFGYVEPCDIVWEMFEEALEPYINKLRKYQELNMDRDGKAYCIGILKGIYDFEKSSKSEFKAVAEEVPSEYFHRILDEWLENCNNEKSQKEMEEYVRKNFPRMFNSEPSFTY